MMSHPSPHADVLLPYMDTNLAQASRTWMSKVLLTGDSPPLPPCPQNPPFIHTPILPAMHMDFISWSGNGPPRTSSIAHSALHNLIQRTSGLMTQRHLMDPKITSSIKPKKDVVQPVSHQNLTLRRNDDKNTTSLHTREPLHLSSRRSNSAPRWKSNGLQQTLYQTLNIAAPVQDAFVGVWGHYPTEIKDNNRLRIVFANPRGINLSLEETSTQQCFMTAAGIGTGILCLAETNVNWSHARAIPNLHHIARKTWTHSSIVPSHTKEDFTSMQQPGGMLSVVCDNWTSRVIS